MVIKWHNEFNTTIAPQNVLAFHTRKSSQYKMNETEWFAKQMQHRGQKAHNTAFIQKLICFTVFLIVVLWFDGWKKHQTSLSFTSWIFEALVEVTSMNHGLKCLNYPLMPAETITMKLSPHKPVLSYSHYFHSRPVWSLLCSLCPVTSAVLLSHPPLVPLDGNVC